MKPIPMNETDCRNRLQELEVFGTDITKVYAPWIAGDTSHEGFSQAGVLLDNDNEYVKLCNRIEKIEYALERLPMQGDAHA